MTKILRTFIIINLLFFAIGCGDDSPAVCPNIDNIDSEVEINGETLFLQMAEVRENATPDLDTYEFLIDAVGSDCNQILKFRFYASVSKSTSLEGDFTVLESIVYTPNQITSFTYTVETLEPTGFEILYATSGEGEITSHSNNEYSLTIDALLADNSEVKLSLRYHF